MLRRAFLILPLVFAFAITACSHGEDSSPPEPTVALSTTANESVVDRMLDELGGPIADWLRAEALALDDSAESQRLLDALVAAKFGSKLPPAEDERESDIMTILTAAGHSASFAEIPDMKKLAMLAALVDVYARGHGQVVGNNFYEQGNEWMPAHGWLSLIVAALDEGLYQEHTSLAGEPVYLIAGGSDAAVAREALGYAAQHLAEVEGITGAYEGTYVLLVVDTGLEENLCGKAFPGRDAIALRPVTACSLEITVTHEMTHLAAPAADVVVWFTEGLASLLGLEFNLTDDELTQTFSEARDFLGDEAFFMLDLFHYPEERPVTSAEYARDRAAGLLFMLELVEIIGYDALGEGIRAIDFDSTGAEVLNALYKATPPEQQAAVRDVIAKWCRRGERNYFTGEEFDSPTCSPSE